MPVFSEVLSEYLGLDQLAQVDSGSSQACISSNRMPKIPKWKIAERRWSANQTRHWKLHQTRELLTGPKRLSLALPQWWVAGPAEDVYARKATRVQSKRYPQKQEWFSKRTMHLILNLNRECVVPSDIILWACLPTSWSWSSTVPTCPTNQNPIPA